MFEGDKLSKFTPICDSEPGRDKIFGAFDCSGKGKDTSSEPSRRLELIKNGVLNS